MRVYPNVRLWSVKEPGGSMILQVGCTYNTLAPLLRRSEFLGKVISDFSDPDDQIKVFFSLKSQISLSNIVNNVKAPRNTVC